jgi:Protein of unknown function (DUF4019)
MRIHLGIALAIISIAAAAQQPSSGIGYPSVAAALEALKARTNVEIRVEQGWTIVNDKAAGEFWSFTPPGHPAHPAAVKRTLVEKDGKLTINMSVLCQASKAACDKLVADFRELNEKAAQGSRNAAQTAQDGRWRPTAAQEEQVSSLTYAYFSARDGGKYRDAYTMFSPTQQQKVPFEPWTSRIEQFNAKAGQVKSRKIDKITWYKDPPNVAPGLYAAVDFSSEFANIAIHCGFVAWHMQEDGSFRVVREEENYIDKVTQQKLRGEDLDKLRAQFGAGCR